MRPLVCRPYDKNSDRDRVKFAFIQLKTGVVLRGEGGLINRSAASRTRGPSLT